MALAGILALLFGCDRDAATFASQAMHGCGVDATDARGSFNEGRRVP